MKQTSIQGRPNRRPVIIISGIMMLLLIPLIAMQFSSEVNWKVSDFMVMGLLLLGVGLASELVLRRVKQTKYRVLLGAVVLAAFLLLWAELAVGIFGSPFAGS